MRTVYTVAIIKFHQKIVLPIIFSRQENADRVARVVENVFRADAWSIVNRTYTRDELIWIGIRWVILHAYGMPWQNHHSRCYFDDVQRNWKHT